ncbi:MAG: HAMP domain-containing histidine kinase [Chloroflexi bacterium]|nr:HAMP domain-containing histidine kinase [Chloroflexota bacterium]
MRSLRGNIVRIFIMMSIANTVLLVIMYIVMLNYVVYRIAAPLSIHRFLPTIMQHYYAGGQNNELHHAIDDRLRLYGVLSITPPRVADRNLHIIYPHNLAGTAIVLDDYVMQYRITLPNQDVIYLLPYIQPSQHPTVNTFYPYLFGGIGVGMMVTVVISAVVGTFFSLRSIKPLEILTNLSTAQNTIIPVPRQLQQQLPPSTTREINQLAVAIDNRDSEIQHQIILRRQLNADIAHELRNPLNTIGGYIEAMRDGILNVTPARLNTMYDEIQSLHQLVDDLRLLAQTDSHEISYTFQPTRVCDLVSKSHEIMTPYAQRQHINLINTCAIDAVYIQIDMSHMSRVLRNIIDNSLRHSNPQSEVIIATDATDEHVMIHVIDRGCGIHPDDMTHLFDRYFRARNTKGSGSGLGLPIAQAIIVAHHGTIRARSELNVGTTVTITLPRYGDHEII